MADTIVAASIQVDTGNSNANVQGLNKDLGSTKTLLKDTGAAATTTGKDVGNTGVHFSNLKNQLGAIPGPANAVTQSVGGINTAFNVLRANPIIGVITIIAGLVILLFQRFQKMEAVSDSLGKAFGALSGLMNTFINKILTPLIEGFTFLVDLIVESATFIADLFVPGLAEAAKRSGELAEALDDLNDAEAESALRRAESNRKLQEARDLANDANVPIKDRIKALREAAKIEKEEYDKSIEIATQRARYMLEQIGIELGARGELLEAIRSGSVEQLKAARNELYAMQSIDKEKIKAIDELIIKAEDEGAQRAKVNKKTESQITSLEKEEQAKRKEQADKAREREKEAQQRMAEFQSKLRQLQQDNELAAIKDGYARELRALEIKLQNDKRLNEEAIKSGKLTREQAGQLNLEIDNQFNLKRDALTEKHNKDLEAKEEDFQKKLAKIRQDIQLEGITDIRQKEFLQLQLEREEKLAQAAKDYAEDKDKLKLMQDAIDEEFIEKDKNRQKKNAKEDLNEDLSEMDKIVNDPESAYDLKKATLDAEQLAIDEAFEAKVISEKEYNEKVKALADARIKIGDIETERKKSQAMEVAGVLTKLTDLVGRQTLVGKGLGIATALINTYQGATEALKQKSTLPSPFDVAAKIVNVAAVVAAGIKSVQAITSVQVPGASGGGGTSAPSISASAPIAPTPQLIQTSTTLNDEQFEALSKQGDATQNRQPVRAYVVEADVSDTQEKEERLNRAARLDG